MRERAPAPVEPRQPREPRRVPRAPAGAPARERGEPVRGGARADRAQPAARVRLRSRRHARGDGERAAAARPPRAREDAEHFAQVRELLDAAGVAYEVDPTLVRGLDYYTRTVFEFTSDALGAQSGVGGGGRYDGLVEQLGGPADARAWAGPPGSSGSCSPASSGGGARRRRAAPRARRAVRRARRRARRSSRAGGVRAAQRGALGRPRGADGARRALAEGPARPRRRARRALRGDRSADGEAVLKDMQGGGQEPLAADAVVHAVLRGHHAHLSGQLARGSSTRAFCSEAPARLRDALRGQRPRRQQFASRARRVDGTRLR